MVNIKIDGAKATEIAMIGTLPDITSELLVAVKVIRDEFNKTNSELGELFIDGMKKGLEFVADYKDDTDKDIEDRINELVELALEDDFFLEKTMEMLPDELKVDFASRMAKRAKTEKEKKSEEK